MESGLTMLFALPTPVPVRDNARAVFFVLAIEYYDDTIRGVICERDRWFYFLYL